MRKIENWANLWLNVTNKLRLKYDWKKNRQ